ncbi:MAG: IS481 family transposase [candidate division Zixibacteria bacterium]|nr:IS481 family transposase [candidate division Zixibacteria bacterium]
MDERIRFVIAALDREQNMKALCEAFGISRPTGYHWLRRYEAVGSMVEMKAFSRRPHHSPRQISPATVDRIVSQRLAYGWGGRKLQLLLAQEGVLVSESTINRTIKRCGLTGYHETAGTATRRFAREHPNDLWQMDFKGYYNLGQGRCYPLSVIDDHSRFALGVFALDGQSGSAVHHCLVTTFKSYGVPQAMLVDHGIPWWSPNGHGLTWLAVALIKQGIQLCFSGLRHPQTQGKVERFHRTLSDSVRHHGRPKRLSDWQQAFDDFTLEYNHIRGHESLQMNVPASRYQPSHRNYQPHPREWLYDGEGPVIRLNSQGIITWHNQRYFVCEALANELVQVHPLEHQLLVQFRHMWIREIDLKTGRSLTLVDKNHNPYV